MGPPAMTSRTGLEGFLRLELYKIDKRVNLIQTDLNKKGGLLKWERQGRW